MGPRRSEIIDLSGYQVRRDRAARRVEHGRGVREAVLGRRRRGGPALEGGLAAVSVVSGSRSAGRSSETRRKA